METNSAISFKRSALLIAFWSFFTGLTIQAGIDRLNSGYAKPEWIFLFALAIVCGIGVTICLRRLLYRLQKI
jgi:hypothetical protein